MAFIVGGLLIGAAGAVAGAAIGSKGQKDAAGIAAAGSDKEIAFNRESRDLVREDQKEYREAGTTALSALMDMTGLSGMGAAPTSGSSTPNRRRIGTIRTRPGQNSRNRISSYERASGGPIRRGAIYNVHEMGPENIYRNGSYTRGHGPATIDGATGYVEPHIEGRDEGGMIGGAYDDRTYPASPPNTANSTAINPTTGFPNENPGGREGGYSFMTDPGYQFRFEEGQRAIDRSASAGGHSLSGGAVKKAIRYGQGMASGEYTNVYNRISNIAQLGQVGNQTSGNAALIAGGRMGNAASAGANASAYGAIGAGNAWANAGNEIARLPWGDAFNRDKPGTGTAGPRY